MHTVLWNGFANRLEVFRGNEEQAAELAEIHIEEGNDVIYFYAIIESITLSEEDQ